MALIEDINLKEEYESMSELRTAMDKGYQQNALNCWIAGIPDWSGLETSEVV